MSDEKNVELGVFEALNALAEEKNASAETRETLRKNVRESSDAQQGTERRRPGRPKKEKAPEVPLDEAIAAGLTNLRNAKAKHAPAPKVAAPAASETEVASTLDSLFEAAEKKAAEPAVVEKTAKVETVEKTAKVEEVVAPAAESAEPAAESAVEVKEETAKVEVVTPQRLRKLRRPRLPLKLLLLRILSRRLKRLPQSSPPRLLQLLRNPQPKKLHLRRPPQKSLLRSLRNRLSP